MGEGTLSVGLSFRQSIIVTIAQSDTFRPGLGSHWLAECCERQRLGCFTITVSPPRLMMPHRLSSCLLVAIALGAPLFLQAAPTIPNPSFELNATPTNPPGYVSGNAPITSWTTNDPARAGLNPGTTFSPFADNSTIPNGARVAFVQSTGSTTTLSTIITGLTAGTWYRVQFRANSRSATSLVGAAYRINGGESMSFAAPAGSYSTVNALFKATATSAALEISNTTSADSTLLVDNFTINAVTPIVVTSNADSGAGSLRAALATVASASGPSVITFAPALSGGTITLGSELTFSSTHDVAIDASKQTAGLTLDGGPGTNRLLHVGFNTKLSITGVTFTGGGGTGTGSPSGGAMLNSPNATLTLKRCTLTGNSTTGGGGAISNGGTLRLEQCTISGNSADASGGGISNGGDVFLTHCTISGNTAVSAGGGIYNSAVYSYTTASASIIAGNTATGTPAGADVTNATSVSTNSNLVLLSPNIIPQFTGPGLTGGSFRSTANPQLSALANNGGATKTMALATSSPARNAAVGSTITSDQRGFPVVGVPDIGAFEVQAGGTFSLSAATYSAFEGGAAEIVISRLGNSSGTFSVRLFTTPGTAVAADFAGRLNTTASDVTFLDGETEKTVRINLIADGPFEGHQTFTVTLSNPLPAGATLGSPATATVTIKDALLVTNLSDTGTGSLRAALTDASNIAGPDGIGFAPGLAGQTITLASEIIVTDTEGVTVDATSVGGLTISGNNATRLFHVSAAGVLNLTRLILTQGNGDGAADDGYGGAVLMTAGTDVTATDCMFTANAATYGGAILNHDPSGSNGGTLTLRRCALTGNTATSQGGAVYSYTPTNGGAIRTLFDHCTLSGNTATEDEGGGLLNFNGTTILVHCTVTANTAQAGKGSGIASYGDAFTETIVEKSIVAGNTNSDVDYVRASSNNSFTSAGSNVIGTGNATGDFSSTSIGDVHGVQPVLAALANNGGPTQTHALQSGSPALDRAASSTSKSDQRGVSIVAPADSGAFEVEASATFSFFLDSYTATEGRPVHCTILRKGNFRGTASVRLFTVSGTAGPSDYAVRPDSPVSDVVFADGETSKVVLVYPLLDSIVEPFPPEKFTLRLGSPSIGSSLGTPAANTVFVSDSLLVTNTNDDGPGSLRATIKAADTPIGIGHTVQFAPALSGRTITLGREIVIDQHDSVTIDASSLPSGITIDGAGYTRLFEVPTGKQLTLRAMTLTGGNGAGAQDNGHGGAIYTEASSTLTLERCTLSGNKTSGTSTAGGAIFNRGTATLTQCTLAGNEASADGGAVVNVGTLTVMHCMFNGNSAYNFGGGIFNTSVLTLDRSILAGNSSFLNPASGDLFNIGSLTFTGPSIVRIMLSPGSINNPGNQNTSDPLLLPLASNGGPTKTCALQAGSPALNAGAGSAITSDQRGFRIIDVPDLGAYETQLGGSFAFGSTAFGDGGEGNSATITIKRLGGNEGTASVRVITQNGTASATDFTARPDTDVSAVVFADGQDTATISISTTTDSLVEANETVILKLSSPSPGTALGSPATATLVIIDPSTNLGDSVNPALPVVTSPAPNAEIGVDVGGTIQITGTATDNKSVYGVNVSLVGPVGGPPPPAVGAVLVSDLAPVTVWKATVTPITGVNSFTVQSFDPVLHTSPVTAVRTFKVLRPLLVNVSGYGSVTAGFAPKSYREVGKPYKLTAAQGAGAMFVNWTILSGHTAAQIGLSTTDLQLPVINFVHREGLALRANFAASPYNASLTGIYNGGITPNTTLPTLSALDTEGFATFKLQSNGAFTGTFKLDGGTLPPVSGIFDASGTARFGPTRSQTFVVTRTNKPAITVTLQIDITPPLSGQITGLLSILDGSNRKCDIRVDRAVYSATNLVPSGFLGSNNADATYSIAFSKGTNAGYTADQYPQGSGVGYYKLTKTGVLTLVGTLPDGTAVTNTSTLSGANTWRLFAPLYGSKGVLAGNVALVTGDAYSDIQGYATVWIRPVLDTQHYAPGWPQGIIVDTVGAKLNVPTSASIVPGLPVGGAASLSFTDGLLAPPQTRNVTVSAADLVTHASSDTGFTMKIDRKTGLYSGTFTHTDGTKVSYKGVIVNKNAVNPCIGFFLTTSPAVKNYTGQGGKVSLIR